MLPRTLQLALAFFVGTFAGAPSVLAEFAPTAQPTAQPAKRPPVTRADLARAYLRLDRAFTEHPPAPQDAKQVQTDADALATLFFRGDMPGAVRAVNVLAQKLENQPENPLNQLAGAIAITIDPPVVDQSAPAQLRFRAASMYPVPDLANQPISYTFSIAGANFEGQAIIDAAGHFDITYTIPSEAQSTWPAQRTPITLKLTNASTTAQAPPAHLLISRESFSAQRARHDQALTTLFAKHTDPTDPLAPAISAARQRSSVLTDRPSSSRSIEFLVDQLDLAKQVTAEIAALTEGRDPYAQHAGRWWLGLDLSGVLLPVDIYAPAAMTKPGAPPAALVIALHGAGGDEAMFLTGYGAGTIAQLADQHNLLIVCPRTELLLTQPGNFDAVITALSHWYTIDRSRIYLVGHSLGGITSSAVAVARPNIIAAAVGIAGGPTADLQGPIPPMLILGAQLDGLIPAKRLAAVAQRAKDAGLPVEYRQLDTLGHTLCVGPALRQAIDWLLEHHLAPPAKQTNP